MTNRGEILVSPRETIEQEGIIATNANGAAPPILPRDRLQQTITKVLMKSWSQMGRQRMLELVM